MFFHSPANRRILWSIIRATEHSDICAPRSSRLPRGSSLVWRRHSTFSVSFGDPETDAAITRGLTPMVRQETKASTPDTRPKTESKQAEKPSRAGASGQRGRRKDLKSSANTVTFSTRRSQDTTKPPEAEIGDIDTISTPDVEHRKKNAGKKIAEITQSGPGNGKDTSALKRELWQVQKEALKKRFGEEGWNPRKRLSPDTLEGIRMLHEQDPERYSTPVLAEQFKVSPEAIRRILKSKWRPSPEQVQDRRERWARRHDRIWDRQAELGLRPKRKKEKSVESPDAFDEALRAQQILESARKA